MPGAMSTGPFGTPPGAAQPMGVGRFGIPPGAAPLTERLLRELRSHWDNQQRVMFMGQKDQGTSLVLRFMASRATDYVQVHVQSDATGKGGFTYDANNFVSSTEVDCRTARLQEVAITRNGTDIYCVFLIPKVIYA